jgi:hypothetical protein
MGVRPVKVKAERVEQRSDSEHLANLFVGLFDLNVRGHAQGPLLACEQGADARGVDERRCLHIHADALGAVAVQDVRDNTLDSAQVSLSISPAMVTTTVSTGGSGMWASTSNWT